MTPIELIAQHLAGTGEWVKMTIADMTDAELMQRPAPAANHGAWNFGHALYSEHEMLTGIGAKLPELPPRFGEIYANRNCKSDNAAEFLKKDQMIPLFDKVHAAAVAFVKTLKPEDLNKPSPESMRGYAPTWADIVLLQLGHFGMHIGQIQVVRRKLGKPVLF
jgi:hypothetical protein